MRCHTLIMIGALLTSGAAVAQHSVDPMEVQRRSHQRQVTLERLAPERRSAQQQAELARLYYRSGRLEEAQSAAQDALKAQSDNAELLILLGDLQGRRQQWAQALASFNRAAQLRPRQADIALRQGQALTALGKSREADAAFASYRALQVAGRRSP